MTGKLPSLAANYEHNDERLFRGMVHLQEEDEILSVLDHDDLADHGGCLWVQPSELTVLPFLEEDEHDLEADLAVDAIPLSSGRPRAGSADSEGFSPVGFNRPEFLSATVFKPSKDTPVGIGLRMINDVLRIVRIDKDGLFGKSNLMVGDEVVSINNIKPPRKEASRSAQIIADSDALVSIVARNEGGDPGLVSAMVAKPTPESVLGIGLRVRRITQVSRIDATGLFANSLLNVGDRCLFLNHNNCAHMRLPEVSAMLRESPQVMTVVAKPATRTAFVVAKESVKPLMKRLTSVPSHCKRKIKGGKKRITRAMSPRHPQRAD